MDDEFEFDGSTFDPERDGVRLTKQYKDVWSYMLDGKWHTLHEISAHTGHPEASVSARLRDFRKKRFGSHHVARAYYMEGLWMYRLERNTRVTVDVGEDVNA